MTGLPDGRKSFKMGLAVLINTGQGRGIFEVE